MVGRNHAVCLRFSSTIVGGYGLHTNVEELMSLYAAHFMHVGHAPFLRLELAASMHACKNAAVSLHMCLVYQHSSMCNDVLILCSLRLMLMQILFLSLETRLQRSGSKQQAFIYSVVCGECTFVATFDSLFNKRYAAFRRHCLQFESLPQPSECIESTLMIPFLTASAFAGVIVVIRCPHM